MNDHDMLLAITPNVTQSGIKRNLVVAAIALEASCMWSPRRLASKRPKRSTSAKIVRERRSIDDVYQLLGDYYFRKSFRMTFESFNILAEKITPLMAQRKWNYAAVNGPIKHSVRVACMVRYLAGGSPYDVALIFGISISEVYESVWEVVDAVNRLPEFTIRYPSCHLKQEQIALGFEQKSVAGFTCCCGAADGILIWIHKPTKQQCQKSSCDAGKFYCGRKHKMGLNAQAVCDLYGRFLDIAIQFPASTADCLAFEGMDLHKRLQTGLLKPGLCLFGDNAYLNSIFMATPYSGNGSFSIAKDNYNFFHSQLRINIECAFGMLTQRWGILRSAMPKGLTLEKINGLVLLAARLHNFCLDMGQLVEPLNAIDEDHLEAQGVVPLEPDSQINGILLPRDIMGSGEHFDGIDRNERQRRLRLEMERGLILLPREQLCATVADGHYERPTPRGQLSLD
jgi:hypothetical protein